MDRDLQDESVAADERDDSFTLWDLRVEVVAGPTEMVCEHEVGDYFEVSGENLSMPPGQTFPIYPLAALLPLLPAKQRMTHPNDWMTTDAEIACPDPLCGGRFRIIRTGKSVFRHGEVTKVPLPEVGTAPPPEVGTAPPPEVGTAPPPEVGSAPPPEGA